MQKEMHGMAGHIAYVMRASLLAIGIALTVR